MNKLAISALAVLMIAGVASANTTLSTATSTQKAPIIGGLGGLLGGLLGGNGGGNKGHQCVPEPISMFCLIPGAAMLIRRRKKTA